ncbi:flavodoxin [Actinorhabdospora filicis]|uniref:Flavodoxin n=1 Tax=Actinorhabdospora filicis TaxID=1785913 RepID=A0A9W6STX9_9ACTN|nr:NAD(P)H-dependent oxidoreductase [Actinorhabdospora filicis]GLZ80681.1 flavodoxin [Actinorhabdospora filicis]
MSRHFVFILGSSRPGGNTEFLTRRAAAALPGDVAQTWLDLRELSLPDFEDIRHDGTREYTVPTGNEKTLLDATLAATDLVIASPLYWYSVSAPVKKYLDYWSAWLRVPGADFRQNMAGRNIWAVSAISEEDPVFAKPLEETLRISGEYMGMTWKGALLGYANRPGDMEQDAKALAAAETFFAG